MPFSWLKLVTCLARAISALFQFSVEFVYDIGNLLIHPPPKKKEDKFFCWKIKMDQIEEKIAAGKSKKA